MSSDWAIEVAQEKYEEERAEWIRCELNDLDADEDTDGWYELESQYDEIYDNWSDHMEEEYEWYHSQGHSNFYSLLFKQSMK